MMGDVHENTKGEVKVFEKVLGNCVKLIAVAFLRQAFQLTGKLIFWAKDVPDLCWDKRSTQDQL
jgi:hypothetical protein